MDQEKVIVIDFGGQYNQLVARRVRECNVYCEIYSYRTGIEQIKAMNPKGIILTGGPNSCYEADSPTYTRAVSYTHLFRNMLEAYEALRSDDKGSRAKTTKEGFLYSILTFLEKQGLIEYVEEDEMVKTSKKLDNLMDWNLLNQNNYQRVRKVLEHE